MAPSGLWNLFVFIILASLYVVTLGDEEFEGLSTLTLEHSLDLGQNPQFSKRGVIKIQSIKTGQVQTHSTPLSIEESEKLKRLADAGGVYRIRVPVKTTSSETTYVSSFIKACLLYESQLSDILTVNLDQSGNLLGISITTSAPYCEGVYQSEEDIDEFNTTTNVVQSVVGPSPETQLYIQKIEQEKAEKAKGQQADNRSFFAKYWMYIVPLVIFLMFASNQDPNAGGQGGGR